MEEEDDDGDERNRNNNSRPSRTRDDHMSNENNDQHEAKNVDTPASVDATPPVPGFGAAMASNNIASLQTKDAFRGTVHAKDKQKQTRRIKINKINYLEDGGRGTTSATVT